MPTSIMLTMPTLVFLPALALGLCLCSAAAEQHSTSAGNSDGFMVNSAGMGSLTGISFSCPAFGNCKVKGCLEERALTSQNVKDLNQHIMGIVGASRYQEIHDVMQNHPSGDLALFAHFAGASGAASAGETHDRMEGFGLPKEDIGEIVHQLAQAAAKMSEICVDFNIENTANNYGVSGHLRLYCPSS